MLDFNAPEFLVVGIVALLIIGPKELPKALRLLGKWVGRARGVARQFRAGFDAMLRESELQELEKQWAVENERIMREHPAPALPAPDSHLEELAIAADPAAAEDAGPVMTAQPDIRPDPVPAEPAPAPAPARKPRKPRKAAAS